MSDGTRRDLLQEAGMFAIGAVAGSDFSKRKQEKRPVSIEDQVTGMATNLNKISQVPEHLNQFVAELTPQSRAALLAEISRAENSKKTE